MSSNYMKSIRVMPESNLVENLLQSIIHRAELLEFAFLPHEPNEMAANCQPGGSFSSFE